MASSVAERLREETGFDYGAVETTALGACPVCAETYRTLLAGEERYGFAVPYRLCMGCGLVYADPRMSAAAAARFYAGTYRKILALRYGRPVDERSIQANQARYALRLVDGFLAPQVRPEGRALDLGGSTGTVAARVRDVLGLAPTVVDPSEAELAEARRKGLTTVAGLAEDADVGADPYELVLLCKTIDHLLDPLAVFRRVRSLVADGGLFFFDIVDFRYELNRRGSAARALKIDHPFAFTQESTEALLRLSGFEPAALWSDTYHLGFLCRPARPCADAGPTAAEAARDLLRFVRDVQSRPPLPVAAPSFAGRVARRVRRLASGARKDRARKDGR